LASNTDMFDLRRMVYISLFTALIAVGGYLSFPLPLSPVPVVLADFFVMLSGLFLGGVGGITSVGLLLFLSLLGLPVLAGGGAGFAIYLGPTGGFLIGYLVCAFIVGQISNKGKSGILKDLVALICGNIFLYTLGVPWLKLVLKVSWKEALAFGLLPFIVGAVIKIIVAVMVRQFLRLSSNQDN